MKQSTRMAMLIAVLALGAATAAYAARSNVYTASANVTSAKAGTKKKPVPVGVQFAYDVAPTEGGRPVTQSKLVYNWTGVQENGQYFPKCTADEIDAAQSDSGCPDGSLMGEGTLRALLGIELSTDGPVKCNLNARQYNAGAGEAAIFFFPSNPSDCGGVSYVAPIKGTFRKLPGGTSELVVNVPDNVTHPLPGLEGAVVHLDVKYRKATTQISVKRKGKTVKQTVGYFQSIGCGKAKERTYTLTTTDDTGVHEVTAPAGKCKA